MILPFRSVSMPSTACFLLFKKQRDLGILLNSFWIPKSLSCSFPVKKHSQSLVFFSAKSRLLNQLNELLIVG